MNVWGSAWVWAAWWCVVATGNAVGDTDCNITIGDQFYKKEYLISKVGYIRDLAVDNHKRIVYFNYPQWGWWHSAKVDIISKEFKEIKELSGVCRFAVDQVLGHVHAGCDTHDRASGGLYQWDSNPGHFVVAGETGQNIKFVHYYNDTLYYTVHDEDLLRTFTNGTSALVSSLPPEILKFVFDSHGDLIFYNWTGIYRRRIDGVVTKYEEFRFWVLALAMDSHGAAYACDANSFYGIWRLGDRTSNTTKLLDVKCTGLTFDADDNIIYGDLDTSGIVRLVKCERPLLSAAPQDSVAAKS